jgi:hypothetical protein
MAPAVASDAGGNFVVVWQSYGSPFFSVHAQRFESTGTPRGSELWVNAQNRDSNGPVVASDAAGHFVVAWASLGGDGSGSGIVARRYDASGLALGAELVVNSYTAFDQAAPAIASDPKGNFVVVWSSEWQDGDSFWDWGVFGQRYDASGMPRGAEFHVNSYTTEFQWLPAIASDATGNFVVVWTGEEMYGQGQDGSAAGVFAQRYDASGVRRGAEFEVNSYTTGDQRDPSVVSDAAGNFVVVWVSYGQDGQASGVFGQRYDTSGAPLGVEFQVNTYTSSDQKYPTVTTDATGNFVVAWTSFGQDGGGGGIFGQRYDAVGAPRGSEFQINTYTAWTQRTPALASDGAGNLAVTWDSDLQDGSLTGIFGQRFGGLLPAALTVDASASSSSDGNGVLEAGETVAVAPSWRNVNGATQTFDGTGLSFGGPAAAGVSYELVDAVGAYGTVANGDTTPCSDCYQVGVTFGGTRPATHWDATFTERLTPDVLGQTKPWSLHIGESFSDVPKTSGYYRFVETLLHKGVTAGCSANTYCPTNAVTREQMSVFVLAGKEGAGYLPIACATPVFGDVPASSPFCRYIQELAQRGVTSGCGGGNYCPANPVTREQMSVFLLHTLDPALNPPGCTAPVFDDVPVSSPFCRWIAELSRRGITSGCGGGNYCPTDPVTREQMAVFISATFGLTLYGP